MRTANVLVDGQARVGELSYRVPDGIDVAVGDAVEVPFGPRVARGVVTAEGDPQRATRDLLRVYGRRSHPVEIAVARDVAAANLAEFTAVARRLAPVSKRGNSPMDVGPVVLTEGPTFADLGRPAALSRRRRRIDALSPNVDEARLAALEAAELSERGPVLVLCPSKRSVTEVLSHFASGAARLDNVPVGEAPSAWRGFTEGGVRVGIATRAAALWGADLAGIVVVDEDHPGHREVAMPYTHARDVAARRTLARNASLVLHSHNPSPAGLGAQVTISRVGAGWPEVHVLARNPRRRWEPELVRGLAPLLLGDVLVVAGSARSTRRCAACRHVWSCEACSSGGCPHCPEVCPSCSSEDTLIIGWDPYKIRRLLPEARVLSPADLRDAPAADTVVFFDVDPWLSRAELVEGRAAVDRILLGLRRVRAGGRAVIVTTEPAHPLIERLAAGDLLGVARHTWEQARDGRLPPFAHQITLTGRGRAPSATNWPGRVLGPRVHDDVWEIIVLCDDDEFSRLSSILTRVRRRSQTRITIV